METPLAQVRPGAQVEEPQLIGIVRDEDDACRDRFPIDPQPEWPPMSGRAKQAREFPPARRAGDGAPRGGGRARRRRRVRRCSGKAVRRPGRRRSAVPRRRRPRAPPADPHGQARGRAQSDSASRTGHTQTAARAGSRPARPPPATRRPRDAEGIPAGFARELPWDRRPRGGPHLDSSLARRGARARPTRSPLPRARVNQEKARQDRASIGPMAS